ncbi:Crp/Fnr family transcriptional regulator [Paenibacillus sp. HB172176]|uniref:Crp/Fnr family transcriptional regulator n=1 Tax=Paenibacillus sp. HB172176 TaxID=2493690 RepID=UPI00143C38CB|nr:Crp/Fnr family transcriptional regulator [Paenibacillus sp. HB172176]
MKLHKGEILFRQGEQGPLYTLKSGILKITRVHEDGHQIVVNLITPGETIPHHSLISPHPYHGTAIALTTSEIEFVDTEQWYKELASNPAKCLEVASLLQSRLRIMQQRIDQLTRVTPGEKLKKLQEWLEGFTHPAEISELLTQDEIGQLIGLRRETVNRLLRAKRSH